MSRSSGLREEPDWQAVDLAPRSGRLLLSARVGLGRGAGLYDWLYVGLGALNPQDVAVGRSAGRVGSGGGGRSEGRRSQCARAPFVWSPAGPPSLGCSGRRPGQEHGCESGEPALHLFPVVEVEVLAHVGVDAIGLVLGGRDGFAVRALVYGDLFQRRGPGVVDGLGEEDVRIPTRRGCDDGGVICEGVRIGDDASMPVLAECDDTGFEVDETVVAASTVDEVGSCPYVPPVKGSRGLSKMGIEAQHGLSVEKRQLPDEFLRDRAAGILPVILGLDGGLGGRAGVLHQRPELIGIHRAQSCTRDQRGTAALTTTPPPEGGALSDRSAALTRSNVGVWR